MEPDNGKTEPLCLIGETSLHMVDSIESTSKILPSGTLGPPLNTHCVLLDNEEANFALKRNCEKSVKAKVAHKGTRVESEEKEAKTIVHHDTIDGKRSHHKSPTEHIAPLDGMAKACLLSVKKRHGRKEPLRPGSIVESLKEPLNAKHSGRGLHENSRDPNG